MKLPLRRSVPLVVLACVFVATAVAVPSGLSVAMRSADQRTVDATHTTISAHLDNFENAFAASDLDDVARTIAELMGDREVLRAVVVDESGTILRGDRLEDVGQQVDRLVGLESLGAMVESGTRAARTTSRPWVAADRVQQRVVGAAAIGPPGPRAPILVIVTDSGPERFKVRHDSVATLGVFLTFVFLTAVVAGLAFQYLVARRASALLAAAERVAAGDLETRTGVGGEDEIGVIAAAFDAMVTRLADRREETRKSEENYRQLFEHAVQPIFVTDADARIRDVNSAGCALLEADLGALRGRHLKEVVTGGDDGDEPPSTPVARRQLILPRDRRIPCEVAWRSLPDGRVLILVRDLRAERDAEALRQALVVHERLAALGTLAASVGHEINNPLTYLLANLRTAVEIIRSSQLPDASRKDLDELLDDAVDGAERVRRIVADLNVFARPTQTRASSEPIDLRDVVERAVNLARPALANRCRVDMAEMPSLPVLADERRLAQVVLNLLTNASQAMPADRGRDDNIVTLRARRDGAVVVLEVADNGVGMTEEVGHRIFEPFFTTKVGHGSGLGLAISRELVVSLGGDISVASAPGKGAVFSVQLRAATAPATPTTTLTRTIIPTPRTTRSTVLVIDDDPLVAQVIARELAPAYDAVTALTVADGMALLDKGHIDCTICDLSMPDGGARTLLEAMGPERSRRVIVVTGGAQTVEAGEFLEGAGRPVITKPIDRARLLACVADTIDAIDGAIDAATSEPAADHRPHV